MGAIPAVEVGSARAYSFFGAGVGLRECVTGAEKPASGPAKEAVGKSGRALREPAVTRGRGLSVV